MSAAAAVFTLAALISGQFYKCPEDVNYDVAVKGHSMELLALYDGAKCTLKGTTAHCVQTGSSLLKGDVYDIYAKVTPETVTLNAPNGVVCRSQPQPK